jgi:hypothetical protein
VSLARDIKRELGKHASPQELAAALGCTVVFKAMTGRFGALLWPSEGNRFSLICDTRAVRDNDDATPQGFRIAHETAHTMFYNRSGDQPYVVVERPYYGIGTPGIEEFCDTFASELTGLQREVFKPKLIDELL